MRMAAARLRVSVATPDGAGSRQRRGLRGRGWLASRAGSRARRSQCCRWCRDRRMRALNRQFRGKDYATDVLSFPSPRRGVSWAKSSSPRAWRRRQARDAGHPAATECGSWRYTVCYTCSATIMRLTRDGWRAEGRLRRRPRLRKTGLTRTRRPRSQRSPDMTPLLLFLLGCAVTYLGMVTAAFNALMRLSLRIHAERTDRDDALRPLPGRSAPAVHAGARAARHR